MALKIFANKDNNSFKKKLNLLNTPNKKYLEKYPIIFDNDLNEVRKIFDKVIKKERANFLNKNFKLFLKKTIDDLYENEIIDKKAKNFAKELAEDVEVESSRYLNWMEGRV